MRTISIIVLALLAGCNQSKDRTVLGEEYAKKEVQLSLLDTTLHNVVNYKAELITDKASAKSIAETILFETYGQGNIKRQHPYEIYKIDNYWIMSGTLPINTKGGTFLIILDSRDSKIIRLTHGK